MLLLLLNVCALTAMESDKSVKIREAASSNSIKTDREQLKKDIIKLLLEKRYGKEPFVILSQEVIRIEEISKQLPVNVWNKLFREAKEIVDQYIDEEIKKRLSIEDRTFGANRWITR